MERKVARVVIGMLDPDNRISGRGQRPLRKAGITTALFPEDLMAEVEELNREFMRDRESSESKARGHVYFVPDAHNNGWSIQSETLMEIRLGGTFTYDGPGTLTVLQAFLEDTRLEWRLWPGGLSSSPELRFTHSRSSSHQLTTHACARKPR